MSFNFSVSLVDPTNSSSDDLLRADVAAAAAQWSRFIDGLGTIDIEVTVAATTRANGGAATVVAAGKDGTRTILEDGTASELRTGTDPNGTGVDLKITVDPTYLTGLWLDPNAQPTPGKTDGLSVFMHEIGHGLGIQGYRDLTTGSLGNFETPWDKLVTVSADGSSASFLGGYAEAVFGGPVPVTTLKNGEQFNHVGNTVTDGVGQDLMNGVTFKFGTRYEISLLDRAIMKDIGLPMNGIFADPAKIASETGAHLNPVYRFADTVTSDHFYTTGVLEKVGIQANLPALVYEHAPWATPDKGAGTTDVFRFFDTVTKTHFLTISATERDALIANAPGFNYEGIAFQAYTSAPTGAEFALERFYNTNSHVHTYAADANEVSLIKSGAVGQGWIDEGASFIVHTVPGDLFAI